MDVHVVGVILLQLYHCSCAQAAISAFVEALVAGRIAGGMLYMSSEELELAVRQFKKFLDFAALYDLHWTDFRAAYIYVDKEHSLYQGCEGIEERIIYLRDQRLGHIIMAAVGWVQSVHDYCHQHLNVRCSHPPITPLCTTGPLLLAQPLRNTHTHTNAQMCVHAHMAAPPLLPPPVQARATRACPARVRPLVTGAGPVAAVALACPMSAYWAWVSAHTWGQC